MMHSPFNRLIELISIVVKRTLAQRQAAVVQPDSEASPATAASGEAVPANHPSTARAAAVRHFMASDRKQR